jgi:ligand-binding sensor domain-containing protein
LARDRGPSRQASLSCLVGDEWVTALTSKPINAIAADAEGRLWLSGDGGTITVIDVRDTAR